MTQKWFYDFYPPFTGFRTGQKIKKLILNKKTPHQRIRIFKTVEFGLLLALDTATQLSERDEFIYHEMLIHPVLLSHPNPKRVLIIGGGDGAALRECLKHNLEEIYLVEIDKEVIKAAKKFLKPIHQNSFSDPRVKIFIEDGLKFVADKKYKDFFDVAIVDCTDPEPGNISLGLFSQRFYKDIFKSLTPSGILIFQSGSIFFTPHGYLDIYKKVKNIFPFAGIYWTVVPSFAGAIWGFTYGSKELDLTKVNLKQLEKRYKKLRIKTKFYNPQIHRLSFYLPNFVNLKK